MKIIGIVSRAYYNKDNQKITQVNEDIRKSLSQYDDIITISLLPTNNSYYPDLNISEDKIEPIDQKKLDYILNLCDGFIIPGGTNFYQFDEYIINYAYQNNKPLLAICLGFQALCSLYAPNRNKKDMTKKMNNDSHYGNPKKYIHDIKIEKNTLLNEILKEETIKVNSLHHDYIDFIPNNLTVSAYSKDGIVEAVESKKHKFFLGIQWHPEYLMDEYSIKIFDYFVNKVKEWLSHWTSQ